MSDLTSKLGRFASRWRVKRADQSDGGIRPGSRRIEIVRPSPMVIPVDADLRREPPRAVEDRQPDYLEKFDDRTLFYDTFRCGNDIWLCGPPLHNLKPVMKSRASWSVDGTPVAKGSARYRSWGRTQRSSLRKAPAGSHLNLDLQTFTLTSEIGSDETDWFAGQRVVVSKNADNDLVWIQDWLRWYHEVHGVTGVVFYENNSTRYGAEEVAEAIGQVEGIQSAAIVDWQFKWGPNGGPNKVWDSDFSQYAMLEHARFKFLRKAAGVINTDIDELVLTDDGRSVFEHAADSESGCVRYHGILIPKVTSEPREHDRQLRFADYRHRYVKQPATTHKWALIPDRVDPETTQWRVHYVSGLEAPYSDHVAHRHYQGLTTGWKYNRVEAVANPDKHEIDEDMSAAIDRVFGS